MEDLGFQTHPCVLNSGVGTWHGTYPIIPGSRISENAAFNKDYFHKPYPDSPLSGFAMAQQVADAPIQRMPTEILLKMFSALPLNDLDMCRFVCKGWFAMIMTDRLMLRTAVRNSLQLYRVTEPMNNATLREWARCFERKAGAASIKCDLWNARYRRCDILFDLAKDDPRKISLVSLSRTGSLLAMVLQDQDNVLMVYHLDRSGQSQLIKSVALSPELGNPSEIIIKSSATSQFGTIISLTFVKPIVSAALDRQSQSRESKRRQAPQSMQIVRNFEVVPLPRSLFKKQVDQQVLFDIQRSSIISQRKSTFNPPQIASTDSHLQDWSLLKHLSMSEVDIEPGKLLKLKTKPIPYRRRPFYLAKHKINGRLYLVQVIYTADDQPPTVRPMVYLPAPFENANLVNVEVDRYMHSERVLNVVIVWHGTPNIQLPAVNTLYIYNIRCPRGVFWNTGLEAYGELILRKFPQFWKIDLDGKYVGIAEEFPEPAEAQQRALTEAKICATTYGVRVCAIAPGMGGKWDGTELSAPLDNAKQQLDFESGYCASAWRDEGWPDKALSKDQSNMGMRLYNSGEFLALWGPLRDRGGIQLTIFQIALTQKLEWRKKQWELGGEQDCACRLHDYGWLVKLPTVRSMSGRDSCLSERPEQQQEQPQRPPTFIRNMRNYFQWLKLLPQDLPINPLQLSDAFEVQAEEVQYICRQDRVDAIKSMTDYVSPDNPLWQMDNDPTPTATPTTLMSIASSVDEAAVAMGDVENNNDDGASLLVNLFAVPTQTNAHVPADDVPAEGAEPDANDDFEIIELPPPPGFLDDDIIVNDAIPQPTSSSSVSSQPTDPSHPANNAVATSSQVPTPAPAPQLQAVPPPIAPPLPPPRTSSSYSHISPSSQSNTTSSSSAAANNPSLPEPTPGLSDGPHVLDAIVEEDEEVDPSYHVVVGEMAESQSAQARRGGILRRALALVSRR
jgi:hypothetical protein